MGYLKIIWVTMYVQWITQHCQILRDEFEAVVDVADSANLALDMLESQEYDLIIIDPLLVEGRTEDEGKRKFTEGQKRLGLELLDKARKVALGKPKSIATISPHQEWFLYDARQFCDLVLYMPLAPWAMIAGVSTLTRTAPTHA